MWKKKIKSKKMQFFLVGLVLFATTALFSMCICFMRELTEFTKAGINEENCPDCYLLDSGCKEIDKCIGSDEVKQNIKNVTTITGKTVTAPISFKGKDISLFNDSLLNAEEYEQFGYITVKDTNKKLPSKGEVWIATTVADPNHIELGDVITLQYKTVKELKVVGFYKSTFAPKAMVMTPMIGNIEDINELPNSADAAVHAVNLKNNAKSECNKLIESDAFKVIPMTMEDARNSLSDIGSLVGGIGSVAGIIVFIVALIIIRFIIRTNLLKEYKAIGIYKSLGYKSSQIRVFYLKGYLLVGFIGITLGAFSSLLLVYPIGLICTKYVEGFAISNTSLQTCAVVIAGLMVLLLINVMWALRRVKRITPVEAIAIGVTSSESKIKRAVIKSAKSPLAMSVNDMFKYKKSTLMMVLVLSVSMFLCMVFVMTLSSSTNMVEKGNLWFGVPKTDVYISGDMSNELRDYVKKSNYVKSSVYGECICTPKVITIDGRDSNSSKEIAKMKFTIMDNMDEAITGVSMTKGSTPKQGGEVSIGSEILKKIDKKVGDFVKIEIDGIGKEYLITGSYKSMMNEGFGAMLLEEDMLACDSNYRTTRAYVRLNDLNDYSSFKNEIEKKFKNVTVDKHWTAVENSVSSIETMLSAIAIILVVLFIIFALLNCVIVLLMDHNNCRRRYGILKSLGFTTRYIVHQTLWKYCIISTVSVLVALVIHKLVSSKLLGAMVVDAFRDSNELLGVLIVGFMVIILGAVWLLSLPIRKISPVELMEE